MSVVPAGLVWVAVPIPVFDRYTWRTEHDLPVGAAVVVPYRTRELVGWVIERMHDPGVAVKSVIRVLDEAPAFNAAQLALYQWMSSYYLTSLGEIIATATPADTRSRTRHVYLPTPAGIDAIAEHAIEGAAAILLREVVAHPSITRSALQRRLSDEVDDVPKLLAGLVQAGLIDGSDTVVAPRRDHEPWVVPVSDAAEAVLLGCRSTRAREVWAQLVSGPKRLADLHAGGVAQLLKLRLVAREDRPKGQRPKGAPPTIAPTLNGEQTAAVAAVVGGEARTWLLHGVTGAGKTEVYLALTAWALGRGHQALVLVPEIALTPQLTARFDDRFPGEVAVLHSALTGAERMREWRKIRSGEARVTVGARSAIFAPFEALGLIVVDEEHDDSYKQDDGVRYNARDLAVVRGRSAGAPVVLGSATPSLESWSNAKQDRYGLLTLNERPTGRPVPMPTVVDMRAERPPKGRAPLISEVVRSAVARALDAGGKAILLYNRRGYASVVECPGCGLRYDCPSCGVSMVYHQSQARLDCHYCGFHRRFQSDCPQCGTGLVVLGQGTERVEETLAEHFPGIAIARLDADTTQRRGSHAEILERFRSGDARLLVGTQIVAKGHDFPDVHVAAVLGVDHILGMPDFRSAERCFSLVTQLCGRAGRGQVAGEVYLQTTHPDHPIFSCIGDMQAFADHEQELRKMLRYPPFSRLVLFRCEGVDREQTVLAARALAQTLRQQAPRGVDVLGPAMAAMPKLVGRYRVQVIVRARDAALLRRFTEANRASWKLQGGIRLIIDVDPRTLS